MRNRGFNVFDVFFTKDNNFRWVVIVPLLIVFVVFGVFMADLIYGDWRCAFAECRIIK